MPDSAFLNKVLGWIKGFINSMSSPLGGFDMDDVKINSREGEYSVLYQFANNALKDEVSKEDLTDIHGNKINLNVLVSTTNVQEVLKPLLSDLNNIGAIAKSDPKKASNLLAVFLGEGRETGVDDSLWDDTDTIQESFKMPSNIDSIFAASNNSSSGATGGLLGVKLQDAEAFPTEGISYEGITWSWENIAGELLKYALECEVPGKDYGAIENISLGKCGQLIAEYLIRMKVIANEEEIHINVVDLIKPAMMRLQADLKTYYDAAYEKYAEIKDVKDTSKEDREAAEKEAEQKAQEEQTQQQQQEAERQQQVEENLFKNTNNAPYRPGPSQSHASDVFKSKQIQITLKKIQGSTDFDLLGLQSNYDPSETLDDVDEIVIQDDFVDALTEEPQTFAIVVDDDGYDVETCETCAECNPCDSLSEIFKAGIRAYRNLYIIHWMSRGNDMMKLHIMAEEMYGELIQEIDTIGELLVEKCGSVPQLDFPCDYVAVQDYDFQTGLAVIQSLISMYIDCIDYAYCNQDSDVQSTLDEWLRYWKKQLNYFVKGQEV